MLVGESNYRIDSGYNSQGPMDNGETPKATISTRAESLLAGLVKCAIDGPYRSCMLLEGWLQIAYRIIKY